MPPQIVKLRHLRQVKGTISLCGVTQSQQDKRVATIDRRKQTLGISKVIG